MQIRTSLLIEELLSLTEKSIRSVKTFKESGTGQLNFKQSKDQWSILECIEHLNLYGDFYLPEIQKQLLENKNSSPALTFKAGLIGNYFANLMKGSNGEIKKMKAPKDKNPLNSALTITTLDRFLKQQELLKTLLNSSRSVNLNKIKISISISKMIKLKLGDTFRFYVYHVDRHIIQAEKQLRNIEFGGLSEHEDVRLHVTDM